MANTYESKFKGVEVDEGVNIARNLTGTGGIEVKKTETGTINATVTIDGSGVKITPVSGTGTSTTDVMSQKAVTDELGKKQDTITNQTSLNVGALNVNGTITGKDLSMTGNVNIEGVQVSITGETITFDSAHDDITFKSRYNAPVVFDVAAQFKGPSGAMFYLGDTGEYVKLMPAMNGTGIYDVRLPDTGGTLALTSDITTALTGKQDKLTTGSEISIKKLQATTIGAQDNGSLTIVDPLTVSNDVYVNELAATKGTFWSGAIVQGTLTGETAHFATGVTVDGYSSFNGIYVDNSTSNPICFKRNNSIVTKMYGPTSGGGELVNVYLPGKGGTFAMTDDLDGKQDTITTTTSIKAGSIDLTGNVVFGGEISCNAEDGNRSLLSIGYPEGAYSVKGPQNIPNMTQYTVYLPSKSGTIATTDEITSAITGKQDKLVSGQNIKTINGQSVLGSGNITVGGGSAGVTSLGGETGAIDLGEGLDITGGVLYCTVTGGGGGGSAGVSSIGGKTGAITLGDGLSMSGQQLVNKVKVYTSGNYLCIDTN